MLAFFTAAAIWLLLRAEFLAIALVVVYVGAVMVLFLFVVMMLDINLERVREGFWQQPAARAGGGRHHGRGDDRGAGQPLLRPGRGRASCRRGYSNTKELGRRALHAVRLRLRGRGGDPAGGDHRRHRPDAAPAQGQPPPGPVASR